MIEIIKYKNLKKLNILKKYLLILTLLVSFVSLGQRSIVSSIFDNSEDKEQIEIDDYAAITFDKSLHDFGTIKNGVSQETVFTYTNTGNIPLIISKITSSCGCTVPKNWSRAPLLPGQFSTFTVNFNGKGASKVSKTINIFANTKKGRESVKITANIVKP